MIPLKKKDFFGVKNLEVSPPKKPYRFFHFAIFLPPKKEYRKLVLGWGHFETGLGLCLYKLYTGQTSNKKSHKTKGTPHSMPLPIHPWSSLLLMIERSGWSRQHLCALPKGTVSCRMPNKLQPCSLAQPVAIIFFWRKANDWHPSTTMHPPAHPQKDMTILHTIESWCQFKRVCPDLNSVVASSTVEHQAISFFLGGERIQWI